MKKYFLCHVVCILFLATTLSVSFAAKDVPVIKVGIYENPPKIYTDEDGVPAGFWPDLIRHMAAEEGWEIEWVSGTWPVCLERLENSEINIMPDTGWTEPRSRQYDFSVETVLTSWSRLYVSKGSNIESIIDLGGKTIAALKGSFNLVGPEGIKEIVREFDLNVTFKEMESYDKIFEALAKRKIDAGVTNKDYGNQHEDDYAVQRTSIIFQPARMQFAFTKDSELSPYLSEKIDDHIKKLKQDKSSIYYRALEQYTGAQGAEVSAVIIPGWVKTVLWLGCGIILFLFAVGVTARSQVRRRTREVQESEAKYRELVENINDVIYTTDENGHVTYISPAIKKVLGYHPSEITGNHFSKYIHPDDLAYITEQFANIIGGNLKPDEYRLLAKSGAYHWIRSSSKPIQQGDKVVGLSGIFTDITERKRLESELVQSHKMEAIGTLAGGIAHDFNNILSAVIGYTELAQSSVEKGTALYSHLEEVFLASGRAKDLVNQILTFSRQAEQERKPVQVKLIAKETLKFLRASLPSTIEIRQEIQSDSLVLADPTQIHQVIMNLCTNAEHAMRETGGVLSVKLDETKLEADFASRPPQLKSGAYLVLTVSDTGYGIPAHTLDRIFDPFFTTKEKGEGTGMGLAVVHGIVGSCEGSITVSSKPGQGTLIKVYFPMVEKQFVHRAHAEKPVPTGTECILFVDDEPGLVDLGKKTFQSLGYEVITRTSSIEALELFKAKADRFDLVITDMTMPNMTGDNLAKELIRINPAIPVIMCTGYSARINKEQALAMGIRALVSKPVLRVEIAKTIREVLDGE